MSREEYDIVIVGGGSGGCVVASYLAEHTDASIALIEAGAVDHDPFIHIPAGFAKMLAHDRNVWTYETIPQHGSERVERSVTTMWRPVGTCRMGQGARAVVDARLRVRGIDGLRVIDASIMPNITSQHERRDPGAGAQRHSDAGRGSEAELGTLWHKTAMALIDLSNSIATIQVLGETK